MNVRKSTLPPNASLIHAVFEAHAARAPEASAIATRDATLSYGALNADANRLARHLRDCGVSPDGLVAICMQRTPALFEAVLAVLKAGGAYVPLDPNYPEERLAQMLSDARPAVVLTDAASAEALNAAMTRAGHAAKTIDVVAEREVWSSKSAENLSNDDVGVSPQHLAYVIYTSGSTGAPKGAMIEHRGVMNMLRAQNATFDLDVDARVLQFASFSFDACVFEWVMAFGHGARLCLGEPGMPPIGGALVAAIDAHGVTHATIPPVALSTLPHDAALSSLRVLISAGEALPPPQMRRWARGRAMFNAYGPTETTVWCAVHACDANAEEASVPIGHAIPGTTAHVFDERRRPLPDGELGELYIGGAGLARGYLHRPELTAERFVEDARSGERLYRTGDLVRRLPDGALEYHGRNDFQVKIRGFRIELGEIETTLTRLKGVEEAVVVARDDNAGQPRLIAYVRANADRDVSAQTLRATLSARLPEYMVPAAYVRMAAWPQTPNGKLDRRALPAPRPDDFASVAYIEPVGDTEAGLAAIWCEVLAIERAGRDDRFLDLGGNSLKVIQLATRIRARFGREMPVDALFKAPSLRAMAAAIDAQTLQVDRDIDAGSFDAWNEAASAATDDPLRGPVSYQQHGLWLLEQVAKTSLAYNAQNVIRIRGEIDATLLQRAVDCVVERHEIFRSTFHDDGEGEQYQYVHASAPGILQTRTLEADVDEAALQTEIDAHVAHRFDLARLPLVRLTLIRRGPADYVLIHVEQHYVHDGWSANLFMRELLDAYAALAEGKAPALPPVPAQYRDYARWQRSEGAQARYARHLAFWTAQLADLPHTPAVPSDRPRPDEPTYAGMQLRCELPQAMASALRRFCGSEGFTLYAALHAVYQIVLHRAGGAERFAIGSAVANRRSRKSEGMFGMFVNMIPIRADVSGNPSYRELLDRTAATLSASYEHEELPFELLVRALQPDRTTGHNLLFQTAFSAHNSDLPNLRRAGFELSMFEAYSNRTSKFDFDVVMLPRGQGDVDGVTLLWNFATDLFEVSTIERLRDAYLRVLNQCLADPDRRLDSIETMAPEERTRLLEGGYREMQFDATHCLHQAFEAHAARAPEAFAIATHDGTLSYGALNADANRLARHLRTCGVAPDGLVAICMQRTPALFEAVLAVLKAGGAYVPLDPNYPEERLAQMLSDARPSVVLTDAASADALTAAMRRAEHAAKTIDVVAERAAWSSKSAENLSNDDVGVSPQHLAYVIYTSGSTG
ncbi:MAG: amino acid adenylation domain-containing protein, partial [Lysobacter sp.]|nr:amino acid adenylation domain-containing protein [Lysobacter sp.]